MKLDETQFSPLIKTDYTVEINKILTGDLKDTKTIIVTMTGGTVKGETIMIRGYPHLEVDSTSILFLKEIESGPYLISGGARAQRYTCVC